MHKLFKNTVFVGKKAFFLPSCHSTNELASVLMRQKEPLNGTVIYTDYQSQGKGQRGNKWESEGGKNILMSVILDTSFVEPSHFFDITIITSLAMHDFLSEYIRRDIKIKWPNDMFCEDRKIAGILIENYIKQNTIEWCILGVGLNVNQTQFMEKNAISMSMICGQQFEREELINVLLQKLEQRYFELKKGGKKKLKEAYLDNMYWRNEIHVFQSEGTFFNGKVVGIEPSGKLRIEAEDGLRIFDFKEVSFVK